MSDVLFVEARKNFDFNSLNLNKLNSLNGKIVSLAASVQYLDLLDLVKGYLERIGKKVLIKNGAFYKGHILGCDSNAFDVNSDVLLLLCDGKFHAFNNAVQLRKEVYVFNGDVLDKVSIEEIDEHYKRIKGKQMKFLNSHKVGLLVSGKGGQKAKNVNQIKKFLEKMGKSVYVFECDNVDISEFENFPDIEIWVNSACFGLGLDDKRIINLSDVVELFKN